MMVFSDLFEKAEAKQHPWPGLGRADGPGVHQTVEAQIGEALGQLETTRTGQFQLLAGPCSRQTEPWSTIHQHLKRRLIRQHRQGLERIDAVEGQSQAEQRVLATRSNPALLGGLENTAERNNQPTFAAIPARVTAQMYGSSPAGIGSGPWLSRRLSHPVTPIGACCGKPAIKWPMYSVAVMPVLLAAGWRIGAVGSLRWTQLFGFLLAAILLLLWENLSNDLFDAETGVDTTGKPHSVVNLTGRRDRVALGVAGIPGIGAGF